jgi:hypothetical protein
MSDNPDREFQLLSALSFHQERPKSNAEADS